MLATFVLSLFDRPSSFLLAVMLTAGLFSRVLGENLFSLSTSGSLLCLLGRPAGAFVLASERTTRGKWIILTERKEKKEWKKRRKRQGFTFLVGTKLALNHAPPENVLH